MPGIAIFGNQYQCSHNSHRGQTVFPLTHQSSVIVGNQPVVTTGAMLPCGAVVASGSATVLVDGKPVARIGDEIRHGTIPTGVIIQGSHNVDCG